MGMFKDFSRNALVRSDTGDKQEELTLRFSTNTFQFCYFEVKG